MIRTVVALAVILAAASLALAYVLTAFVPAVESVVIAVFVGLVLGLNALRPYRAVRRWFKWR